MSKLSNLFQNKHKSRSDPLTNEKPNSFLKDKHILANFGYHIGRKLDSGSFATVRYAEKTTYNGTMPLAVKVIDKAKASPLFANKFLVRELAIWPNLKHRHIIQVENIYTIKDRFYVFMELAAQGSVIEYLQIHGAVEEDLGRNWCKRMCQALQYCHSLGIAHRDLKCDNLLLDKDLQIKIGDFGFCCRSVNRIRGTSILSETYCGRIMGDNEDFRKQLELEDLEKRKQENAAAGDPYTYTDPDGAVYEWDLEKQAWFPKVDDDFIAQYQANYNYQSPDGETKETIEPKPAPSHGEKRKANDPCWFQVDDDHNTNVYVSGLPPSTTEEEFIELMSKCGLLMKDPDTMKYKIKLYREADGSLKGDGRCCYIKIESVKLALDILDGYLFKGTHKIRVEKAQFELKGQYDPSKKPRKKKAKDKEKIKKKLEKLFDWRPDKLRGMRSRHENTVIIKNMFDPKEFEDDATLLLDYQNDVREECSKCGDVKKVVIYDRNPEGVVSVTFAEPEMADECINLMNGRWFAARQLKAETWDGKTKYKVVETEEEREKRLKNWEKFLEDKEAKREESRKEKIAKEESQVNVPRSTYDQAGETDSSGDSDGETVQHPKIDSSNHVSNSNNQSNQSNP